MSWWDTASEAQKLAQIDGGIECGLTAAQVAMASSVPRRNVIDAFAAAHGRRFPMKDISTSAQRRRVASNMRARAAYLSGNRIDLWGNTAEPHDEFRLEEVAE